MIITNADEYEAAVRRIQDLSGCLEGTPEEVELRELIAAADEWDRTSGGEAAGDGD